MSESPEMAVGVASGPVEVTRAVVFEAPGKLAFRSLSLPSLGPQDVLVDVEWTGISTGTEKLLWYGDMPPFPGMGYPLVPGYETVGRVVEAGDDAGTLVGQRVFVGGANCFGQVRGLFGGAASRLVVDQSKVTPLATAGEEATLLALAATAWHALHWQGQPRLPELIVGHGVLGRLLARLCLLLGGNPPTVWEKHPARFAGATGYDVVDPADDARADYPRIMDVCGDPNILDTLISRLARQGEIILAGFYPERLSFEFPPAFMREASIHTAAEWQPDDLKAVSALVDSGELDLSGLISHRVDANEAADAYAFAFDEPDCLKMILDWRPHA